MKVIEKQNQFDEFIKNNKNSKCYIVPIFTDINKHSLNNALSLLYVYCDEEFLICFDHSESQSISLENLALLNDMTIYTHSKSKLNHIYRWDNVLDIGMLYYLNTNNSLEFENIDTPAHTYFKQKYHRVNNVNKMIPINKHLEYCREMKDKMKRVLDVCDITDTFLKYNDVVINNLSFIDTSGLKVNRDKLPFKYQRHISKDDFVFTRYNPYTLTGRPANKYGGLNFSAMNKSDGSREPFVSRFDDGVLIEMDYDAYHLRLIADIVGYDFPDGSVHEYLGKQYGVDYEESKKLSFKYLYGGISDEIAKTIPFFELVKNYVNNNWEKYNKRFSVKSYIYNRKIGKNNLQDMNPNKLFNYLIQLNETEYNMEVISKLQKVLEGYESKLVLYQYDSFLFDFCMRDGKEFLLKIKEVIEDNTKFPVKISRGLDYNNMLDITEKLNVN